MTTSTTRTPLYSLWLKGLPQNRRFCGKRSRSGMSDFSRLRGNERYEVCGDESRGSAAARNGGFFHGRGHPGEMEDLCSFLLLLLLPCKLSSWRWALALPCGAWSICWRATARITQRPKARASSSLWLIKCNKSEERKSTIQTEPAVRSRNIVETQDFCYNGYRTFDDGKRGGSLCTSAINRYGTL